MREGQRRISGRGPVGCHRADIHHRPNQTVTVTTVLNVRVHAHNRPTAISRQLPVRDGMRMQRAHFNQMLFTRQSTVIKRRPSVDTNT